MIDANKVKKGLQCCQNIDLICMDVSCFYPEFTQCPYHEFEECIPELIKDALALVNEQTNKIDANAEEIRQLRLQLDEAMLWR